MVTAALYLRRYPTRYISFNTWLKRYSNPQPLKHRLSDLHDQHQQQQKQKQLDQSKVEFFFNTKISYVATKEPMFFFTKD